MLAPVLIDSTPVGGSTIQPTSLLTFTFNKPVSAVTVNGNPAQLSSDRTQATFQGNLESGKVMVVWQWSQGTSQKEIDYIITKPPTNPDRIRATLEQFARAFATEDIEAAMAAFSPNYRSQSGQATKAQVRQLLEETFKGWEITQSDIVITNMDIQEKEAIVEATHTYSHVVEPEELDLTDYNRTFEKHSIFYLEDLDDEWLIFAWVGGSAGVITIAPYPVIVGEIAYIRAYTQDEGEIHNLSSYKNLGGTKGGIEPEVEIFNQEKFEGRFIVPNYPFEDYEVCFALVSIEDEEFEICHPLVIGLPVEIVDPPK